MSSVGVFFLTTDFLGLSISKLFIILEEQHVFIYFLFIFVGLMAVSTMSLYDFILSKELKLELSFLDTFKIGWVSNAVANFIGEAPTTYGGISYFLYQTEGIDSNKATLISIIKNTLLTSTYGLDEGEDSPFLKLAFWTRFQLLCALGIQWLATFIFFAMIMGIFNLNVSLIALLGTFILASIPGRFTNTPGDIGAFDIISLYLLMQLGASADLVLAGLIIYRLTYSIIPWITALLILATQTWRPKPPRLSKGQKHLVHLISVQATAGLIFSAGVLMIISGTLTDFIITMPTTDSLSPFIEFSQLFSLSLGAFFIILSKGIFHKVKSSYYITSVLLVIFLLLEILKGWFIGETIFLFIVLAVLIPAKSGFYREGEKIIVSKLIFGFIILFVATSIYYVLYGFFITPEEIGVMDMISRQLYSLDKVIFHFIALLLGSLLLNLVSPRRLQFIPPTNQELTKAQEFLTRYPGNSMTHLIFLKDKSLFFTQDERVLIAYKPYKDKLMVLGDPIGDETYFKEAINDFRIFADRMDMAPIFYEVNEKYLPIYHENGFNFLKFGEEASFHLADFTLEGKKWAPIRTIKNKMLRHEFDFEIMTPTFTSAVFAELQQLSDKWLDGRNEKGFSLGFFDEAYINLAPVALLRKDGELIAFATLMPTYQDGVCTVDLMRLIPHPPNGTMDALFIGIIEWAREEGHHTFILGKAPLSNVGQTHFSTRREKLVKHFYHYGNKFYSFKGLRFFKEKFHPSWESVYLAYPKSANLPLTIIQLARLISGNDN